jgi:hypothetical protein
MKKMPRSERRWGYKYMSIFRSKKKAKAYADRYRGKGYTIKITKYKGKYYVYIYKIWTEAQKRRKAKRLIEEGVKEGVGIGFYIDKYGRGRYRSY